MIVNKTKRINSIIDAVESLEEQCLSMPELVRELNSREITTVTGHSWSEQNLRNFLKKYNKETI